MRSSLPPKKSAHPSSPLWLRWEKTLQKNERRIILIEANSDTKWTATSLTDEALKLSESLSAFARGTKIAFCLPNEAHWVAFFLALQKRGLTAVPLDASLPDQACLEMAPRLGCHALYLHGKIHAFENSGRNQSNICCIKVTSGTGGDLPKRVHCRADHLIADGTNIIRSMGIRPDDRNLAAIPLGHSYGLGNFIMPLILQGTPIVCAARFVPRQLIDWIGLHGVTVFPSVPAIFRVLASMPIESRLAPLRLAISAGAPLTADVARAFHDPYKIKIHNFYGSSETGGISYDRRGDAALTGSSVGKPLAGVTVAIKRGIIQVTSAAVAKPSGHWRMPDRAEWNNRGELVLLGRRGREVNLGGKKVHPSEIEHALRSVSGVSDALVWITKSGERDIVQVAVETRLSLAEIQHSLASKLPEWKHPKHYLLRPELPRTARGKIDIAAMRRELQR